MAELNEDLLEEALNSISNSEASKPRNQIPPQKSHDDRLNEIFDSLGENFADDILKNLTDVSVDETNDLIENVLGELISKEILYEPFICLKEKIEKEIEKGNFTHEKGLNQIKEILRLMEENDNQPENSKNKDKLMQIIYELQEQGDLWGNLVEE